MAIDAGGGVVSFAGGGWAVMSKSGSVAKIDSLLKIAPIIHKNMLINATPTNRGFLRPKRSTPNAMKIEVATILTIP